MLSLEIGRLRKRRQETEGEGEMENIRENPQHLQSTKALHFPSVQMVLKDNASEVIVRLGQVYDGRFCDLDQLEPCVSFIGNAFMKMWTHQALLSSEMQRSALMMDSWRLKL